MKCLNTWSFLLLCILLPLSNETTISFISTMSGVFHLLQVPWILAFGRSLCFRKVGLASLHRASWSSASMHKSKTTPNHPLGNYHSECFFLVWYASAVIPFFFFVDLAPLKFPHEPSPFIHYKYNPWSCIILHCHSLNDIIQLCWRCIAQLNQ